MRVIFGYDFDAGYYPDALGGEKAAVGTVVAGPLQLLNILETRLGLGGMEKHGAVRIAEYLHVLSQIDNGARFYSSSFKADAWSTAKQLLEMRDELVLAGWQGNSFKNPSRRLADLTVAELLLRKTEYCRGMGERLQQVLDKFQQGLTCGITAIEHADALDKLPLWCQKLFKLLLKQGVRVEPTAHKLAAGSSDLSILQQCITGRDQRKAKQYKGDGSICVIKAATDWEAAESLASWLVMQESLFPEILLVAGATGTVLNDRLHAHGLPGLGRQSRSRWRAVLQVLPLVLSNLWEPFDPDRLLELLTLPKSPVPKYYGNHFINALCEHPGIDGPEWERAWEMVREAFRNKKYPVNGTENELRADLMFWLGEKRFAPEKGMPVKYVQHVCLRVAEWAAMRGGVDDDGLLIESAALARSVAETVAATGVDMLPRPQLERILDSVVGQGMEHPESCPQASSWSHVSAPGQIWGAADTIVWWNFTKPGTASRYLPWNEDEIKAFNASGVAVENPVISRMREVDGWRRPVLFAGKRLILFFSENTAASNGGMHPMWDEIRHLLCIGQEKVQKLMADASVLWKQKAPLLAGVQMKRQLQAVVSPPVPHREWPVNVQSLTLPDKYSVSGIENLISCPLSWFFSNIIRLSGGDIASLPDLRQIVGSLCHRIIEDIFKEKNNWMPDAAKKRAGELFEEYLPQMAAILLHPGYEVLRKRYGKATSEAVKSLVRIINEAGLSVMESEASREKKMPGIAQLNGRIDMILADAKKETVFMDLKWSSYSKYKREEIKQSLPLQLAAYSWLLSAGTSRFPPGGYYMLAQQELLFTACESIPSEHIVGDIDLKDVWNDIYSTLKNRIIQLQSGHAVAEGIVVEQASTAADITSESDSSPKETSEAEFSLETKCNFCTFGNLCSIGRIS